MHILIIVLICTSGRNSICNVVKQPVLFSFIMYNELENLMSLGSGPILVQSAQGVC